MKRKSLILKLCAISITLGFFSIGFYAFANRGDDFDEIDPAIIKSMEEAALYEEKLDFDITDEKYIAEGDKRDLLIDDPEPIFKCDISNEDFFDIDTTLDKEYLESVGAYVIFKEVMTYADYIENFDSGALTSIAPDCLVWVRQVYYPKGFETKRGLFKDATVTGLYDAKTGFYHGFFVTGECDEVIRPLP